MVDNAGCFRVGVDGISKINYSMVEFQLELCRVFKDVKQTLGEMSVGDFTCFSLELPDLNNDGIPDNEKQKSCIPDGTYPVIRHRSEKFGDCFWVQNVPGRDAILIHGGTHYGHTHGCILPGTFQRDITKDGLPDNVESKKALAGLLKFNITSIKIWTRP